MRLRSSAERRQLSAAHIMLGGAPLAGLFTHVPPTSALRTVCAARQRGVCALDTAPQYGLGVGEQRLGAALAHCKAHCAHAPIALLATKVGRIVQHRTEDSGGPRDEYGVECGDKWPDAEPDAVLALDYSAAGVCASLRASEARLGTRATCVRVHDADEPARIAAVCDGGAVAALRAARGELRVSLGVNDAASALELLRRHPAGAFDNVMLAGCWNLLDQSGAPLLAECERRNIAVHIAGVFGSGLLWGGDFYRSVARRTALRTVLFTRRRDRYERADASVIARLREWEQFCDDEGVTLQAAALAFAFRPAIIEYIAIGMRSEEEGALCTKELKRCGNANNYRQWSRTLICVPMRPRSMKSFGNERKSADFSHSDSLSRKMKSIGYV